MIFLTLGLFALVVNGSDAVADERVLDGPGPAVPRRGLLDRDPRRARSCRSSARCCRCSGGRGLDARARTAPPLRRSPNALRPCFVEAPLAGALALRAREAPTAPPSASRPRRRRGRRSRRAPVPVAGGLARECSCGPRCRDRARPAGGRWRARATEVHGGADQVPLDSRGRPSRDSRRRARAPRA